MMIYQKYDWRGCESPSGMGFRVWSLTTSGGGWGGESTKGKGGGAVKFYSYKMGGKNGLDMLNGGGGD